MNDLSAGWVWHLVLVGTNIRVRRVMRMVKRMARPWNRYEARIKPIQIPFNQPPTAGRCIEVPRTLGDAGEDGIEGF